MASPGPTQRAAVALKKVLRPGPGVRPGVDVAGGGGVRAPVAGALPVGDAEAPHLGRLEGNDGPAGAAGQALAAVFSPRPGDGRRDGLAGGGAAEEVQRGGDARDDVCARRRRGRHDLLPLE